MDSSEMSNGHMAQTINGVVTSSSSTDSKVIVTSQAQDDTDTDCGFSKLCKLSCGQHFCNNSKCILFWFSCFFFIQGYVVNGVTSVNVSTFEQRFRLTSRESGMIMAAYDLANAVMCIPVTIIGTWMHQPRIIAISAIFAGLGSYTMFIPHYVMDAYKPEAGVEDICNTLSNNTVTCGDDTISRYQGFLVVGQLLHGIGCAAIFSLGPVYLSHNLSTKSFSLYQGLMYSAAILGPAVGFVVGAFLLNIYVDFDRPGSLQGVLTPKDPRWVGAWWVSYLASGTAFLLVCVIIFPYPRQLPEGKVAAMTRRSEAHNNKSDSEFTSWKQTPQAFKDLLTNPVLTFIILATVCDGLLVGGLGAFLPKLLEDQFALPASVAGIYAGAITVAGAAGGNLAGGVLGRVFNLRVSGNLRICIVSSFVASFLCIAALMRCDTRNIIGLNNPYPPFDTGYSGSKHYYNYTLESSCNVDCQCTKLSFAPICYEDDYMFFSGCHTGCRDSQVIGGKKVFFNCSCLPDTMHNISSGQCSDNCHKEKGFLAIFFIVTFLVFVNAVPTISVILRCVPEKQQSMANGIQNCIARFLGSVPGPILFGELFDRACVIWQDDPCGYGASCWILDTKEMSIIVVILSVVLKAGSCVSYAVAYCCYHPPQEEKHIVANDNMTGDNAAGSDSIQGIENPSYDYDTRL